MEPYTEQADMVAEEIREEIPDVADLLKEMIAKGASDLHITTESPPMVRVSGRLQSLPYRDLDAATTKALMYSVMDRRAEAAVRGEPRARLLVRPFGHGEISCQRF